MKTSTELKSMTNDELERHAEELSDRYNETGDTSEDMILAISALTVEINSRATEKAEYNSFTSSNSNPAAAYIEELLHRLGNAICR